MYMIWFVLDQKELLDNIQRAWEEVGITGATIIESSGFFRRKKARKFIASRYIIPSLSDTQVLGYFSIFSIVESEEMIQAALEATEKVTGDLSLGHRGIFSAWPLMLVKGLRRRGDAQ